MNCYICDIDSNDENHCSECRFEVYPIQEWMRDITGDPSWTENNAPFIELHKDEAYRIEGFIAGGQMPFEVKIVGNFLRLIRIEAPNFIYVPFVNNV